MTMATKTDYTEFFDYIDLLSDTERKANLNFRLRQKFGISRGKAQKIVGEYYRSKGRMVNGH